MGLRVTAADAKSYIFETRLNGKTIRMTIGDSRTWRIEGAKRPARARNARTLLSTFLNWCAAHPTYKAVVTGNAAQSKEAKKHLGKPQKKDDALQREGCTDSTSHSRATSMASCRHSCLAGGRRNMTCATICQQLDALLASYKNRGYCKQYGMLLYLDRLPELD